MRIALTTAVIGLGFGTTVAIGQSTVAPIRLSPQFVARTAATQDVTLAERVSQLSAQLAEQHNQIVQLTAQTADQHTQITQLQNSLKTVAVKGFDTAGKLEQLRTAFVHHDHFYTFATQSGDKQILNTIRSTPPSLYCTKVGSSGQAIDQYKCSDGY